jgi:hypothetical protein
MPGVDVEVIRHVTGNKTKTIRLSVAHILEYLRMKRVHYRDVEALSVFIRCPYDDYKQGEKIPVGTIEIQFHERKNT